MGKEITALEGQCYLETVCYKCRDFGWCQGSRMKQCRLIDAASDELFNKIKLKEE